MAAGTGNGTTLTHAAATFIANIISITPGEQTREALNVSHLGSVSNHEFIPGDLIDSGEFTVTYIQDVTDSDKTLPPMIGAELWTITLPEQVPAGNPPTITFTGFVTSRQLAPLENDTVQVGTFTIKPDGVTTDLTFTEDAAS